MIKKHLLLVRRSLSLGGFLFLFLFSSSSLRAQQMNDEGMWLLSLIQQNNIDRMNDMGCELSAGMIYNTDAPSIKDAIVSFGGFCTGEFISEQGLLITNHHCGYDAVAGASDTGSTNYLDNGFFAKNKSEEIPIKGLFIRVLVKMEDVTDSIYPIVNAIDNMDARAKKSVDLRKALAARGKTASGLDCDCLSLYYGNKYYRFYYKKYTDVRLCGVPPQSVGKFGGDTDNWMWPRHTGDFSMFRVYANENNEPADYSATNIPYKPKNYLSVSLDGYNEGDFTMIMGFPGNTNRYLTSYAMDMIMNYQNPAYVGVLTAITSAMKVEMDKSDKTRLMLSSHYAQLMNSQKLFESQIAGMNKMDIISIKKKQEMDFANWLSTQPDSTKTKYGGLMSEFDATYATYKKALAPYIYNFTALNLLPSGGMFMAFSNYMETMNAETATAEDKTNVTIQVAKSTDGMFDANYLALEPNSILNILKAQDAGLKGNDRAPFLDHIISEYPSTYTHAQCFEAWVHTFFPISVFGSESKMQAFIKKPNAKLLAKDELYQYYASLNEQSMIYRPLLQPATASINKGERLYIQALFKMNPDGKFYPDANSTERMTYGMVKSYYPKDAVHYTYQTHFAGVIAKMDNTNEEFMVPDKLYQLFLKKDYGQYADETGDVPVCFLSTNDITGGNSGSPIMNDKGQLLGLAFDGNYEGTPGDYAVDPKMNRTISVDIRYVLFIIDKLGGAKNLVDEMTLVK